MSNNIEQEILTKKLVGKSIKNSTYNKKNANANITKNINKDMERYKCLTLRNINYSSNKKYFNKLIIIIKKFINRLLTWYIEPICEQQTKFNEGTIDVINSLNEKIEELNKKIDSLKINTDK